MGLKTQYYFLFIFIVFLSLLCAVDAKASNSQNFLDLTLSQSTFSGKPEIAAQSNNFSTVSTSFAFQNNLKEIFGSSSFFKSTGLFVAPMNENSDFEVAVPELYLSFLDSRNSTPDSSFNTDQTHWALTVGRKKHDWSELDEYWNLGIWQPLARWDAANPIQQGLIGLFLTTGNQSINATFMASGLFIPDQQPNAEVKNGKIISSNRWFRAPVDSALLHRNVTDIYYDLQKPSVSEVVNQESYLVSLWMGQPKQGAFFRISGASKPQNQFHLVIDDSGATNISLPPAGNVNGATVYPTTEVVYPMVVRQKTLAIETGYRVDGAKILFSYNLENFERPEVPVNWLQTELIDSRYYGLVYDQSLKSIGLNRSSIIMSYVEKDLVAETAKSTFVQGNIQATSQKFQFEKMASFEYRYNMASSAFKKWMARLKYTYSIADRGEWLMAGLSWQIDRNWSIGCSGDVFGVPEGTLESTSFISKYRGNDRLTGNLSYVF